MYASIHIRFSNTRRRDITVLFTADSLPLTNANSDFLRLKNGRF